MSDVIQRAIKLLNVIQDSLFIRALLKGTAAGTEHRRLLQTMDCKQVVDIGANRGQFALILRQCFPDARIDSFKPLGDAGVRVQARLTGPFQDAETERGVHIRLARLSNVEYLDPLYGDAKMAFYRGIDVLLFPARYITKLSHWWCLKRCSKGCP